VALVRERTIRTERPPPVGEVSTLMENDFQYCYDQCKKRWDHSVTSEGSYVDGDNL